jgi:hypothetical protein
MTQGDGQSAHAEGEASIAGGLHAHAEGLIRWLRDGRACRGNGTVAGNNVIRTPKAVLQMHRAFARTRKVYYALAGELGAHAEGM